MAQLQGTWQERVAAANKLRDEQAANRPENSSNFYQDKNTPVNSFFNTQYAPFQMLGNNFPVPDPGNYNPTITAADLEAITMPSEMVPAARGTTTIPWAIPGAATPQPELPVNPDLLAAYRGITGMAAGVNPNGPSGANSSDSKYTLRDRANPAATSPPAYQAPARASLWNRFKAATAANGQRQQFLNPFDEFADPNNYRSSRR